MCEVRPAAGKVAGRIVFTGMAELWRVETVPLCIALREVYHLLI